MNNQRNSLIKQGQDEKKRREKYERLRRGPPTLYATGRGSLVLRYQKTNASDAAVRAGSLSTVLWAGGTSITGHRIFDSVKVTKLEAWLPPAIHTTATGYLSNKVEIDANTPGFSSSIDLNRIISDTPCGDRGAYVSWKPKANMSYWLNGEDNNIVCFRVKGPIGVIVDCHLSYQLGNAAGAQLTCTGATAGVLYANQLDGANSAAPGTSYLQPINLFPGVSERNAYWT